jgi:hypothetical protein
MLEDLQKLYSDRILMLNQRNIEKLNLYLEKGKVLKAAGVDPNYITVKERQKLDKRNKRKYITGNQNKQVLERELQEG